MWQEIKKLNEDRAALLKQAKDIDAKATGEKRALSAEEKTSFDKFVADASSLDAQIAQKRQLQDIDDKIKETSGGAPGRDRLDVSASGHVEDRKEYDGFAVKDLRRYSLLRAINCLADKRPVDGVEGEINKELAKRSGKSAQGFFFPTDIPTGAAVDERRTLFNTTTGTGSVATIVDTANFIDLLRNRLVVQAMGATFLTGLQGNLALPKQTQGGTAYWVAEGSAPTTSNQVIGQVSFAPKTVGAFTDLSRKLLLQSSISAEAFVRNDLSKVLGLELDRAALNGSGSSNQPTGILQNGSVTTIALGTNGLAPTYAHMVAMETAVATANADAGTLGYVTNPKVRGVLKQTLQSSVAGANWVWQGGTDPLMGTINGYKAMASNQVPSNLTKGSASGVCSAAIFGNWADLILAFWSQLDILVDPYSGSTSGTVRVVALQDADINLRHTESFQIITDILTA